MPDRPPNNLFTAIPEALPNELAETLLAKGPVRIERIVSRGHTSAEGYWYDQAEHEWVAVLQGKARLALADPSEEVELRRGDSLFIPAHRRHRVTWTDLDEDTVWLAVFFAA